MQAPPVLIVGAGPVGLAAALSLAQAGIPVRLVDQLAEPTNQSRAAIIHARTLEMLERLGVVDEFLAVGVKVHGVVVHGPGGQVLARPTLDHLPTHYPYMLGVDQCTTERLLAEKLAALGVQVERRVEFTGLESSAGHVTAHLRTADGAATAADFSFVLGADGARSAVRHALGLQLEGETLDATWITADVRIRWDRPDDEAVAYLSHEGIAFIAPMNGGRWRVIINTSRMTPAEAEKVTLADVQSIVSQRFGLDAPLYDCVWVSPFSINTRLAPTLRVGRVFLAGDAAHVHSPLGGQGMNTGLQDALNLTWKLALVHRGAAPEALLDSYDAERHANAKHLLARIGPATKMMNLRQPVAVEIRNRVIHTLGQLGLTANVARTFSMLGIAYPDSPIIENHRLGWLDHGPHAGHRAPDVDGLVWDGAPPRRLYELWRNDPRHQLLVFSGTPVGFPDSDFVRVLRLDAAADPEGSAREAYGLQHDALILVRPDGYIAFRGPAGEPGELRRYLAKWLPGAA